VELPGEPDLRWGGREEIISANDLADAELCVIDDNGEVVGGGVVLAGHDKIFDSALAIAVNSIEESNRLFVGSNS
jgi:hypothetical protein